MFRGVEGVYKANRSLLGVSVQLAFDVAEALSHVQKLNEIGGNPNSANPKALGDLLMRWVRSRGSPSVQGITLIITRFRSMIWKSLTLITARATPLALMTGRARSQTLVYPRHSLCFQHRTRLPSLPVLRPTLPSRLCGRLTPSSNFQRVA